MKCIRNRWNGEVRRVTDEQAERIVKEQPDSALYGERPWEYCPKSDWKENNPIPRKKTSQTEVCK